MTAGDWSLEQPFHVFHEITMEDGVQVYIITITDPISGKLLFSWKMPADTGLMLADGIRNTIVRGRAEMS